MDDPRRPVQDGTYDAVIVGSGAGAMTAAALATRFGLRTVVVEKSEVLGGTSAYSGAACWLPGSSVQDRAGVPDSADSAREYLRALLGESRHARIDAFVQAAPRVVDLLEEDPTVRFEWRAFPDYFDRPGRVPGGRSFVPCDLPRREIGELADLVRPPVDRDRAGLGHADGPLTAGRALIARLLLSAVSTGLLTVHVGAEACSLLTQGRRVTGVEVRTASRTARLEATSGVVLGSGGFERDQQTRTQHGVPGTARWSMAPEGSTTGAMHRAGRAVGADTELLAEAWWCPGLLMPDGSASFTLGLRGGIVVDSRGRRYANESLPYDQMGRAMAAAPERHRSYLVFSGESLPAIALPGGTRAEHLAAGTWVTADTLEDLAAQIDVDASVLARTVEEFDADVCEGEDTTFGRGRDEYDRFFAPSGLVPLGPPPYTAARLVLSDLGTKGGLVVDEYARVLRTDGEPIAGLWAVGNASASFTDQVYPGPGIPIGTAMAAALLAVEDLASSP